MTSPQTAPDAAIPIAATETRNGVFAALGAYVLWGFLPILFGLLSNVGSVMIVAERTLWSLLLAIILGVMGKLGEVLTLLTDWRKSGVLLLSAALLACNWLLFVWAVETGQVLEVSFGYFINPLVNVAIGMVMLGERQNRMQAIAILIAVIAIAIQAAGLGGVPFIALGLALSFGFYGFFRKTAALGPAAGLFAETLLIAPLPWPMSPTISPITALACMPIRRPCCCWFSAARRRPCRCCSLPMPSAACASPPLACSNIWRPHCNSWSPLSCSTNISTACASPASR